MYFPTSRCGPSRLASISPWRAGIPVEQEIDAFFRHPRLASALFPFMRGVAWYGGVRTAVPATRPIAFDRAVLAAVVRSTPALCIHVVRGSLQRSTVGEPRHLLVIGIGDVHDPEWISSSKARFRCNVQLCFAFRFHGVRPSTATAMSCADRRAFAVSTVFRLADGRRRATRFPNTGRAQLKAICVLTSPGRRDRRPNAPAG
jgi:hypothetical protein